VQEQAFTDGSAEAAVPGQGTFATVLRLPAEADEVGRARTEARQLAQRAGFTASRCADVALAVGEVCANVVVHAYRDRTPGAFVLEIAGRPGSLDVRVVDQGCGLSPRSDSPGAGYGLPLVAAIASALELRAPRAGGTDVRMAFSA
jgi:serine/threonine-protein kinase RsbW/stage II sporulation protein AB (anti-sigma F factor)